MPSPVRRADTLALGGCRWHRTAAVSARADRRRWKARAAGLLPRNPCTSHAFVPAGYVPAIYRFGVS